MFADLVSSKIVDTTADESNNFESNIVDFNFAHRPPMQPTSHKISVDKTTLIEHLVARLLL